MFSCVPWRELATAVTITVAIGKNPPHHCINNSIRPQRPYAGTHTSKPYQIRPVAPSKPHMPAQFGADHTLTTTCLPPYHNTHPANTCMAAATPKFGNSPIGN